MGETGFGRGKGPGGAYVGFTGESCGRCLDRVRRGGRGRKGRTVFFVWFRRVQLEWNWDLYIREERERSVYDVNVNG